MTGAVAHVYVTPHDELIVAIDGEVDVSNVAAVTEQLAEATDTRRSRCFIDLSMTRYMDSSGIRMLFTLAPRLAARRTQMQLIAPASGMVRRLLEITDVPRVIPVLPGIDAIPPAAGAEEHARPEPDGA
jgi:anti-anti-sigma factor